KYVTGLRAPGRAKRLALAAEDLPQAERRVRPQHRAGASREDWSGEGDARTSLERHRVRAAQQVDGSLLQRLVAVLRRHGNPLDGQIALPQLRLDGVGDLLAQRDGVPAGVAALLG